MEDSKQSKKLALKLCVLLCFNIFTIQPNFFIWSIAIALYSFIVGFFFTALIYKVSSDSKSLLVFSTCQQVCLLSRIWSKS